MAWTELRPGSLEDLYLMLNTLSDSQLYVFRGHASATWAHLTPTIHRNLRTGMDLGEQVMLEAASIAAFRRHARSLLRPSELSYFDRILDGLTLMQHYGAPTRLLDWTLSPWVAAYFAADSADNADGAIWTFNQSRLSKLTLLGTRSSRSDLERQRLKFEALVDATTIDDWASAALRPSHYIRTFRYQYANAQMSAQQSLFTISGTLGEDHDVAIGRLLRGKRDKLRITVPAQFKHTLRQRLFRMNVNALSLFPSIEGVGRYIAEAISSDFPLEDQTLLWLLKRRVMPRAKTAARR